MSLQQGLAAAAMLVPREHETPENKAPLIRALAALLIVIAILAALVRLVTRFMTVAKFKTDDVLVISATFIAIVQSGLVIAAGSNGLGKLHNVSEAQTATILKSQYASDALFIAGIALAKLSATRSIWAMAPREKRRWILINEIAVVLWAVSSVAGSLFQCSLPRPWDHTGGQQCFNRTAFWIYVDGLNILTDVYLTLFLSGMFFQLKTTTAKKVLVICVFSCRILIIPPLACHMYFFNKAALSNDPIFDLWPPAVLVQVIQCMTLLATCIPFLKPFLDSLDSGQMAAGDWRGATRSNQSRSGTGQLSDMPHRGTGSKGLTSVVTMASHASRRRQMYEMMDLDKPQDERPKQAPATATAVTAGEPHARETHGSWDRQSHNSQTVLVETTWAVNYERESRSGAAA